MVIVSFKIWSLNVPFYRQRYHFKNSLKSLIQTFVTKGYNEHNKKNIFDVFHLFKVHNVTIMSSYLKGALGVIFGKSIQVIKESLSIFFVVFNARGLIL